MKKHSLIWLYLSLVFLILSGFSFYYLFYPVTCFFLAFVLLNLSLLFFDCQRNNLCRFFIAIFVRFTSFLFLALFITALADNLFSFIPKGILKGVINQFIWLSPILFLIFYSISVFFAKIIKAANYKNLAN